MSCICNCNPNFHKSVGLTADGVLTISNPTNISNLDPFEFVLTINPNTVIAGAPVNYTITVNGVPVALKNRLGLPISTDRLRVRKPYYGYYVVPTGGDDPYVIFLNTPCNIAFALSSASVVATSDSSATPNPSTNTSTNTSTGTASSTRSTSSKA